MARLVLANPERKPPVFGRMIRVLAVYAREPFACTDPASVRPGSERIGGDRRPANVWTTKPAISADFELFMSSHTNAHKATTVYVVVRRFVI